MLLDRHRVVRAALDGRVVADDDAFGARHAADAGDDARARRVAVVHAVRRHRRQFQERRARIDQVLDAVARQQLAARHVLGARGFAAAQRGLRQFLIQVIQLRLHGARVVGEVLRPRIDAGFDDGHGVPPVLLDWNLKALVERFVSLPGVPGILVDLGFRCAFRDTARDGPVASGSHAGKAQRKAILGGRRLSASQAFA